MPRTKAGVAPKSTVLDRRALNRALCARQHLLERARMPALAMIEHLVGLQAQDPKPPYIGLWTRLADFDPTELSSLLEKRAAVRLALMRSTIHLVSARDAIAIRPLVQPVIERSTIGGYGRVLEHVDVEELAREGRKLLEKEPMTFARVGALLAGRFDAPRRRSPARCAPSCHWCRSRPADSGGRAALRCTRRSTPGSTALGAGR